MEGGSLNKSGLLFFHVIFSFVDTKVVQRYNNSGGSGI